MADKREKAIPERPAILARWAREGLIHAVAPTAPARRDALVRAIGRVMRREPPRADFRRFRWVIAAAVAASTVCVVAWRARSNAMESVPPATGGIATRGRAEVSVTSTAPSMPASTGDSPPTVRDEGSPAPGAETKKSKAVLPPSLETSRLQEREAPSLGGQNVAFAAAMKARQRGDDSLAVQLLEDFIAHYPGSPLEQDAHVERFRALVQAGEVAAASRGARRYLALYPNGFARDEARELVLRQ